LKILISDLYYSAYPVSNTEPAVAAESQARA